MQSSVAVEATLTVATLSAAAGASEAAEGLTEAVGATETGDGAVALIVGGVAWTAVGVVAGVGGAALEAIQKATPLSRGA